MYLKKILFQIKLALRHQFPLLVSEAYVKSQVEGHVLRIRSVKRVVLVVHFQVTLWNGRKRKMARADRLINLAFR